MAVFCPRSAQDVIFGRLGGISFRPAFCTGLIIGPKMPRTAPLSRDGAVPHPPPPPPWWGRTTPSNPGRGHCLRRQGEMQSGRGGIKAAQTACPKGGGGQLSICFTLFSPLPGRTVCYPDYMHCGTCTEIPSVCASHGESRETSQISPKMNLSLSPRTLCAGFFAKLCT